MFPDNLYFSKPILQNIPTVLKMIINPITKINITVMLSINQTQKENVMVLCFIYYIFLQSVCSERYFNHILSVPAFGFFAFAYCSRAPISLLSIYPQQMVSLNSKNWFLF